MSLFYEHQRVLYNLRFWELFIKRELAWFRCAVFVAPELVKRFGKSGFFVNTYLYIHTHTYKLHSERRVGLALQLICYLNTEW